MKRLLPFILLAGCSSSDDLYLPVHVVDRNVDPSAHLESIEGVYDIEVREVPPGLCAVTLHPYHRATEGIGIDQCLRDPTEDDRTFYGCRRDADQIFCIDTGDTCAHEVGHVAGLNHRSDPENVMANGQPNRTGRATKKQKDAVKALALGYLICRGVFDGG